MDKISYQVQLYIYDLSKGLAALVSPLLIGKQINGIWHTSVVVYEREYFFCSSGIESCPPGATYLGPPVRKLRLGDTEIPYSVFIDYLNELSHTSYEASKYELLKHNCNHFTEELSQFLCGAHIPTYILDLPNEVLRTKLGPSLEKFVYQLERSAKPVAEEQAGSFLQRRKDPSPEFVQLNNQVEEARVISTELKQKRKAIKDKLAHNDNKKEKKRKGKRISFAVEIDIMADTETLNGAEVEIQSPSEQALQFEEDERLREEERKKAREPPIVFREAVDVAAEYEALAALLVDNLAPEEVQALDELHQYMLQNEGSWVVGEGFLNFIGRLLNDTAVQHDVRIRLLNILAAAALKDDVILVLHQDRRDHVLMNYAFEIDRIGVEEQLPLALFIANMFENLSSSEWLMYISEWTYNNQQISNIRVTTKVAVHSLLSDVPELQNRGTAIIYNMACKEVFDDVAIELAMALLQYFNSKPPEENLWRSMKSLAKFAQISGQEVPQLIQMIGPHPNTFKGVSERVDEQIQLVCSKIR